MARRQPTPLQERKLQRSSCFGLEAIAIRLEAIAIRNKYNRTGRRDLGWFGSFPILVLSIEPTKSIAYCVYNQATIQRMLLEPPNKIKLPWTSQVVHQVIATRSKDATRGSWPYY